MTGITWTGTDEADKYIGSSGDDILNGGDGNDEILGGDGNDTLRGGAGYDTIFGGDGDDIFFSGSSSGGAFNDLFTGGLGKDIFYVQGTQSAFAILDFTLDFSNDTTTVDELKFIDGDGQEISKSDLVIDLGAYDEGTIIYVSRANPAVPNDQLAARILLEDIYVAEILAILGNTEDYFAFRTDLRRERDLSDEAYISGVAENGRILTAVAFYFLDDGAVYNFQSTELNDYFSYQWYKDGSAISGATERTYALSELDIDQKISILITYSDTNGTYKSLTSAETAPVSDVGDAPTGSVAITGTASEGNELTAITSTIADTDGLGTFSYQWLANGTPIGGASNRSYTLTQSEVGKTISVQISYTDGGGTAETLVSMETAVVINVNDSPQIVSDFIGNGFTNIPLPDSNYVSVTGSISDGAEIFSHGTIFIQYAYSGNMPVPYRVIFGDETDSFLNWELGADITEFANLSGDAYNHVVTISKEAQISTEDIEIFIETQQPYYVYPWYGVAIDVGQELRIFGQMVVGEALYLEPFSIADEDGLGAFNYQWLANGTPVVEATNRTYTPTQNDVGKFISVQISYTDGGGTAETLVSAQTSVVIGVNQALTGAVTISGTAAEDQTLTAITSTIADEDGLGALRYQWLANGTPISGATSRFYTLTQNEVGKSITAQVSYTDGAGTTETLTSPPTSDVVNVNDPPQFSSNFIGNGFTNIPSPDSEFILVSGTIANGGTTFLYGTIFVQYAYSGNTPVPYKVIIGDEADEFSNWDSGRDITQFTTLSGNAYNNIITISDEAEISKQDIQIFVNSQSPYYIYPWYGVAIDIGQGLQVSGQLLEGEVLSLQIPNLTDEDGLGALRFQWLANGTPISGATSRFYILTQNEVGKSITAQVIYTDGGGTTETLVSPATSPVQEFSSFAMGFGSEHITDPTIEVVYDGNFYRLIQSPVNFNEAITQAESTYFEGVKGHLATITSEEENLIIWDALVGPYPSSYQEPGNPWIALSDATNEGIWIWQSGPEKGTSTTFQSWGGLEPSNTNNEDAATLHSGGRGAWNDLSTSWQQWYIIEFEGDQLSDASGNYSPTGILVISGDVIENQTLTAITSSITDEDGLGSFSYQWLANGTPVSGAINRFYTLTQNEVGKSITAQVSYTDGAGTTETLTSPPTSDVVNVNDAPTGILVISGDVIENQTLTAITSSITDEDGLGSFSYQWLANGTPVSGAINRFYTLTQNEVGKSITAQVSYTDGAGTTETLTSPPTSDVVNVNDAPTGILVISGDVIENQTLTAITSSITDEDGLGSFSYQWLANGTPVSGAINRFYTLTQNEVGKSITAQVSYTDGAGTTEILISDSFTVSSIDTDIANPITDNPLLFIGTVQSDNITATGLNDIIIATQGNDTIYGGEGIDTIKYSGEQKSYTLFFGLDAITIVDRRPNGNGSDTVFSIELLNFDTEIYTNLNLNQFNGASTLSQEKFSTFIELYIAYFNRAPDALGLNFWATAFANGTSVQQMAGLFAVQAETLNTYPNDTTNADFAAAVYDNALGRIPDSAGFNFWVNVLDNGSITRDQFILEVLLGVQDGSSDRSYLDKKVDVGAYFAVHKGMSDTGNAAAAMQLYDGTEASIQTVKQAIDAYHLEALDPVSGEFLLPLVGVLDNPFV